MYGLKNLEFGLSAAARGFIQNEIQLVDGRVRGFVCFPLFGLVDAVCEAGQILSPSIDESVFQILVF